MLIEKLYDRGIKSAVFTKGHVIGSDKLAKKFNSQYGIGNGGDLADRLNELDASILLGFNSIAVEEKALLFLKYMEKFKGLLKDHYEDLAKLQNKIESITKGSADASRSGEKIKNELEKIEHELKEINKKS